MADDRAAADLARVKGREAEVRGSIRRHEPEVDIGPFTYAQLGLSPVLADEFGGLWCVDGTNLVLLGAKVR